MAFRACACCWHRGMVCVERHVAEPQVSSDPPRGLMVSGGCMQSQAWVVY
jgi:hypothetical protein